ncbi:hypothetical protein ACQ4PT_014143 [Festuca glaucescens]
MGTRLFLLLLLAFLFSTPSPAAASPHISAVISQPGLDFAKDLLVPRATETLAQLSVPDIEQSVYIPLIGTVRMVASDIVLEGVTVADSTVAAGDTGVVVAASFSSVNLTMRWSYSYDSWFVTISDSGNASIQVEGMDVGVSMGMKNENGSLKLFVTECACYMKDLDITLSGGSSWFYQVFIDGFSNHIRSSVENAITNKITEGASKLDLFLESIPKEIYVDKVATVNVTFVNDPLFKSSSVQFDIDGLFIPSDKTALSKHIHFALYFKAGSLQHIVDEVPDQFLLNTASWRFLIPKLYRKYPNEDMLLNISAISPPSVRINVGGVDATVDLDVIVNVLGSGDIVPVACISLSVAVSGGASVSGNNLVGRVELNYFSFNLKWSNIGKLHTTVVQSVMRIVLKKLFVPYVNSYLGQGFPLPIIKGFLIKDAYILTSQSRIIVSSDVSFVEPMKTFRIKQFVRSVSEGMSITTM